MKMVIDQLKALIAEKLGMEEKSIHEGMSITEDLKADSLDMVEITMSVEDKFGIKISDDQLGKFKTVGDIANYIASV